MDAIWQSLLPNAAFLVAFIVWEMDRSKHDREERAKREQREHEARAQRDQEARAERSQRDTDWQKTVETLNAGQTQRDDMWRMWIAQFQAETEKFMESLGRQLTAMDAAMDARYAQIGEQIAACQTDFKTSSIKFSQMEVQVALQLDAMYRVLGRVFPEIKDAAPASPRRRGATGELSKK